MKWIECLVLPTSLTTFYYSVIWVCISELVGVPVICTILYLGGPAGSMHGCQTHRSNCTTIKICVIEPCCCKNHVPSAMKVEATEAELWTSYFKTFGWHACHRNQSLLIFRVEEVSLRQLGSLCGYNTSGHTDMTSDTTALTLPLKIAYSESRSFRTPKKVINTKQALSRFWDAFRNVFFHAKQLAYGWAKLFLAGPSRDAAEMV